MKKFKVTYTQVLHDRTEKQGTTEIEYTSEETAQAYADQLNKGGSYKNAKVIPVEFTRAEYLENKCTHEQYYGQFVTPGLIEHVVRFVGRDAILKCEDKEHLNKIPLSRWDGCAESLRSSNSYYIGEKMRKIGDSPTLSGWVCICKAAAKEFISNNS